jgi:hypothetical protein
MVQRQAGSQSTLSGGQNLFPNLNAMHLGGSIDSAYILLY